MEDIVNEIVTYAAVIGPAVTSILSIIIGVILGVKKVKDAANSNGVTIKDNCNKLEEVKHDCSKIEGTVTELNTNLTKVIDQNTALRLELGECNRQLASVNDDLAKTKRELNTIKNQLTSKLKGE